jgi:hypothetical protein
MFQMQYYNSCLKNNHINKILNNYRIKYTQIKNEIESKINHMIKLFLKDILVYLQNIEEVAEQKHKINEYDSVIKELDLTRAKIKSKISNELKLKNEYDILQQENCLLKLKINSLKYKINNLSNIYNYNSHGPSPIRNKTNNLLTSSVENSYYNKSSISLSSKNRNEFNNSIQKRKITSKLSIKLNYDKLVKSRNKIKKKEKKEKISKYVNNKTLIKNFNGEKSKNNNSKKFSTKNLDSYQINSKPINKFINIKKNKKISFFKETNSYTYDESEISLSKSNISKREEEININSNLLSKLEKAYPTLSSYDLKNIYKLLKDKDYFKLTIFEIMNIIQREASIKITENKYNDTNDPADYAYNFPVEFLDSIDPDYINNEHLRIMKYYKTMNIDNKNDFFETKEMTEDFFYDKNTENKQKRRKVIKYLDGSYNYIPMICPNVDECDKRECIYSHNEYEINYHPLFYKTKYYNDTNYCESNMSLCPSANNFDEDFRIIYNYKDSHIIDLMNILITECKNNEKRIKSFYNKIKNFNLKTFKIFACKKKDCDKDQHLCYKYHKITEKRRPPYLYRYINEVCDDLQKNEKCENGDFCNKCHTSNEFNYHKLNFQKLLLCKREIKNGKCEFIDTCYAFHDYNNEETKKKILREEKENEIQKLKKEYNIDNYKCQKCIQLPKSFIFYYLECKHILCKKCFNKNKSDKKCPLCKKSFKIGEEIIIDFKESGKNIDESMA